ncbi:MAG: hypothetical protein H6702_09120 [Myxococcales bacterium]|nr:hypothetical protein [Myxococcales bacterium]
MRTLWPLLLTALAGCSLFFDDGAERAECAVDTDCLDPLRERCDLVARRCVARGPALPQPDGAGGEGGAGGAGGTVEMDQDVGAEDAGPDLAVDAGPDLAMDAARPAPTCFTEAGPAALTELAPAAGAAPWAFCTAAGVVWLAPAEGGLALVARAHPDAEPQTLTLLPTQVEPVVAGAALYHVTPNPDAAAAPNVRRVDLTTGAAAFPLPRPAAQRQPAAAGDDLALVERDLGRDGVVLKRAGGLSQCRQRDADQWGPALGADWAAWFERGARGRTELVVARGPGCTPRIAVPLAGAVDREARLHSAGRSLFWLQATADGQQHLWRLDRDALVDGPVDLDADAPVHRVELVAGEGWVASARYQPGLYVVEALWAADPGRRSRTANPLSARHPTVGGGRLIWAEQDGYGQWRVQHQPLPEVTP